MKIFKQIDRQRGFAIALIVLQAAALAFFCQTWIISPIVFALALFAMSANFRRLPTVVSSRFPLMFPLAYVLHKTILPSSFTTAGDSFLVPDASLIATYFLFYQLATLFAIYENDRLPNSLPILAITGLIFVGDIRVEGKERLVFQVVALLLVVFSIGFYLSARRSIPNTAIHSSAPVFTRGHRRWLWVLGIVCCAVSWISSFGLYRYSREIESALGMVAYSQLRPNAVGFSGNGRIGSVAQQKGEQGKRVAVRVFSGDSPGYLRGKVFDRYSGGQWQRQSETKAFAPNRERSVELTERLEIWPAQSFREVLFTPLGVTNVDAPAKQLLMDVHHAVTGQDLEALTPYSVWPPGLKHGPIFDQASTSPTLIARMLSLPNGLDPKIQQLAQNIVGDAVVTEDKIAAVENFFEDNFEYQFGIDVPSSEDPIEYFLLNRPPAHCEFFASGAVMLLRCVGVPCRYVTGFVAAERNKVGGYWVARNRDAHAWVEAFDPQFGWVIVEPTLAAGVPQSNESDRVNQAVDATRSWWQQLLVSIRSGRAREVLIEWLIWLILPVTVLAVTVIGWRTLRRFRRAPSPRDRAIDPKVERLQRILKRMDARWHRDGLPRHAHETLDQFALRLQSTRRLRSSGSGTDESDTPQDQAAIWYRRFAAARYSGQVNEDLVEELAQAQRRVCQEGSS